MNLKKSVLLPLTTLTAAAVLSLSVSAAPPGFSGGYVPFTVTGRETTAAVRHMDDFVWNGKTGIIAAAEVNGESLDDGTYYFHIEPVMDDDLLRRFKETYGYYKGCCLLDAELVDIDFWDTNGNNVSPDAAIYFQRETTPAYYAAFVYEHDAFVPVDTDWLLDTVVITPPHYSRFVLASYSMTNIHVDPAPITPLPDPTPVPSPVSSRTDEDTSRIEPSPVSEPDLIESSEVYSEPKPSQVSDDSEPLPAEDSVDEESSDAPSDSEPSVVTPVSVTEEDSQLPSAVSETQSTVSVQESKNARDAASILPNGSRASSAVQAPDGTAATGDTTPVLAFVVLTMTAGLVIVLVLSRRHGKQ